MSGLHIVLEGLVGAGKTTHAKRLQATLQVRYPEREVVLVREPGGDAVAEAIRTLAQAQTFTVPMEPMCEAYLFAAARAQTLRTVVAPALARGAIVLSDRNFVSSLAFQGAGRGLGIDTVLAINQVAIANHAPDAIFFLDLPVDVAISRLSDQQGDKFELLDTDFFKRVQAGYWQIGARPEFASSWQVVDASRALDEVYAELEALVLSLVTRSSNS